MEAHQCRRCTKLGLLLVTCSVYICLSIVVHLAMNQKKLIHQERQTDTNFNFNSSIGRRLTYNDENTIEHDKQTSVENKPQNDTKIKPFALDIINVLGPTKECQLDYKCKKPFNVSRLLYPFSKTEDSFATISLVHQDVLPGGSWWPTDCISPQRIALILPYRDRLMHLQLFIKNIIPFLKIQKKAFTIFVLEQVGKQIFNKAHIMNAGFMESQKLGNYSCFIFHDVDMIPVHKCNIYSCTEGAARHLGLSRNILQPKYAYLPCMGGASAYTKHIFERSNGFTNSMFGWGGEDDDAFNRLRAEKVQVLIRPPLVGNYYQPPHEHDGNNKRIYKGRLSTPHVKYRRYDGLNTVNYTIRSIKQELLYTLIKVSVPGPTRLKDSVPYLAAAQRRFKILLERDHPELVQKHINSTQINASVTLQESDPKVTNGNQTNNIKKQNVIEQSNIKIDGLKVNETLKNLVTEPSDRDHSQVSHKDIKVVIANDIDIEKSQNSVTNTTAYVHKTS